MAGVMMGENVAEGCRFIADFLSVDVCVRERFVFLLVTRHDIDTARFRIDAGGAIHVLIPNGYQGDLNLKCFGHLDVEVREWVGGDVNIECGGSGKVTVTWLDGCSRVLHLRRSGSVEVSWESDVNW